ncbi:hypothetical protein BAE44_0022610 [Dichanthelium oligosanthes]|uniref:Bifunctional inhibitor/plant lipid transfer protein/seed storage helical domain-containing protein n=1 Tax=Dichanthelium oligosanthes TaxID=888268 RepID=A0A1E5UU29_9POAL|nr:hypothetical protein BAE44_0022610 [Dichanthelium oligosanthes]
MMKQQQQVAVAMAVLALVLVLAGAGGASAASCNVAQLAPCGPALSSGAAPSSSCCSSLKAQRSCFCQYAKNPAYGRYINSPNAKKIIASCGVTVPRC